MVNPRVFTAVNCDVCGKKIGRKADLARHMKIHATNKEELMYSCHYFGCTYKALQRSNLETHLSVHTGERPRKCPTEGCDFSCADPGSLTRHRKEMHGYEPKANSRSQPSASTRKAARQRRRVLPYSTSSSTSRSSSASLVSLSDPSCDVHHTPRPQLLQMLDLFPPSSVFSARNWVKEGVKNSSAAFNTHLITKHVMANGSHLAANTKPECLPHVPGLLMAPEAPMVNYPQLPEPEHRDLYGVDPPAQSVSEMISNEVTDAVFDNFLAQFDDPQTEVTPVYTGPSIPTSMTQYTVDNATVASLPPYVDGCDYTVDDAPVASLPQYIDGCDYPVDNAPLSYIDNYDYTINNASYAPHGCPTEAMPFDAQFSQPCSFAAPDMGVYPHVVDQTYMYTTPVGASNFPMQGLYVY